MWWINYLLLQPYLDILHRYEPTETMLIIICSVGMDHLQARFWHGISKLEIQLKYRIHTRHVAADFFFFFFFFFCVCVCNIFSVFNHLKLFIYLFYIFLYFYIIFIIIIFCGGESKICTSHLYSRPPRAGGGANVPGFNLR